MNSKIPALLFLLAGVAFVVVYFVAGRVLNLGAAAVLFSAATVWVVAARNRVPPN